MLEGAYVEVRLAQALVAEGGIGLARQVVEPGSIVGSRLRRADVVPDAVVPDLDPCVVAGVVGPARRARHARRDADRNTMIKNYLNF